MEQEDIDSFYAALERVESHEEGYDLCMNRLPQLLMVVEEQAMKIKALEAVAGAK